MPVETITLPVRRNERIAPEVFQLELGPLDPPPAWRPGQWASLHLPVGPHPPLVRAYTMAAPPDGSGILPFVYDRVAGGLGSGYLARLRTGDTVQMAGILGKFVLPEPLPEPFEAEFLFAARYTGVVPIRAMLLALANQPAPPRVRLVLGARRAADLLFHEEFRALAASAPWFEYHPIVLEPDPGWDGLVGEEIDAMRRLPDTGRPLRPMLCGVRAFTQPARAYLIEERGFERRAVRVESYD